MSAFGPKSLLLLFAILSRVASAIADVPKEVVAITGDPVPAASSDATWLSFGHPYVDSDGNLALHGQIDTLRYDHGVCLMAAPGGDFRLVARTRDLAPVPQTIDEPVMYQSIGAYGSEGGRVLLRASVVDLNGTDQRALVVASPTVSHLVVRTGDQLDGMTAPISYLGTSRLDASGAVTFMASATNASPYYIYRCELGGIPNLIGTASSSSVLLGSQAGYGMFSGVSSDLGGSSLTSVRRLFPDRAVVVAKNAMSIPGHDGLQFNSPSANSCNTAGKVLFTASPSATSYNPILWLGDGESVPEFIAQVGEEIPRTKLDLTSFSHFIVNRQGDVAFISGPTLCLKRSGQPLTAVVHPGMPAPPTFPDDFPTFHSDGLHLSGNGNLVFGSSSELWVYTSDNQLQRIARAGEEIDYQGRKYTISRTELLPTDSGGEDSRRRMISDNGRLAFRSTLTRVDNGSQLTAIMLATLPRNGDPGASSVAIDDVRLFRSGPGVPVRIPVLANDVIPTGRTVRIYSVTQGTRGKATIDRRVLRYVPNAEFVEEDRLTYTLLDSDGYYRTADVVVRNPFRVMAGTYKMDDGAGATFTLSIAPSGAFTGRFKVEGHTFALRGSVDEEGYFEREMRTSIGRILIGFYVHQFSDGPYLQATIDTDQYGYNFGGSPFGLPDGTRPEQVTMQLRRSVSPWPDDPGYQSVGFAIGKLSKLGHVRLTGRLPDNHRFTAGARMKRDGSFSIQTTPYGPGRGFLRGEFLLTPDSNNYTRWGGTMQWARVQPKMVNDIPVAGFETTLDADLATFKVAPGDSSIRFEYAWLGELQIWAQSFDAVEQVWFNENDVAEFVAPNWSRAELHINRVTGLVRGSFVPYPGTPVRRSFQGAVFVPKNEAAGIIPDSGFGGFFLLKPAY